MIPGQTSKFRELLKKWCSAETKWRDTIKNITRKYNSKRCWKNPKDTERFKNAIKDPKRFLKRFQKAFNRFIQFQKICTWVLLDKNFEDYPGIFSKKTHQSKKSLLELTRSIPKETTNVDFDLSIRQPKMKCFNVLRNSWKFTFTIIWSS